MDDQYFWIKNINSNSLLRSQITNNRIFLCDRCLNYFYSEEKLKIQEEN